MSGNAAQEEMGVGFQRDPALVAAGYQWHVLQTRSRQEKVVVEALSAAGASPFLPLQRRVTYYGHRKRVVETPLFGGYVFLWGLLEHAYLATSSKRAVRVIPVLDQVRLDNELAHLHMAIERGAPLVEYARLVPGTRVRVEAGPFQGLEGLVEDEVRNDRLILEVKAIGRSLSLEIDASLLEPVD